MHCAKLACSHPCPQDGCGADKLALAGTLGDKPIHLAQLTSIFAWFNVKIRKNL